MSDERIKLAVLVIAAVCSAASAVVHAQSRQSDLAPGGRTLEPTPDGIYFLPVTGMESVTLRFEPGEMPVELVALRIDADGDTLWADIQYVGEKAVTGWQVKVASVDSIGRAYAGAVYGTDWGASDDPRMGPPPGYRRLGGPYQDEGPIRPGEVRSVEIGSPYGPELEELVVTVPLLVFEDTSYLGSDRLAHDMLENRTMEAEETTRWLARIDEILESTSSEWELSRALEKLVAEMEAVPDIPLRPGPTWARHAFERDLRDIINSNRSSKSRLSKRERVRELVAIEGNRLEAKAAHVPEELPKDHRPPRSFVRKNVEEGPGGDPVGDPELECECGGSILDRVARNESMHCGPSRGWTVNEDWDIDCLNASGSKVGSDQGMLAGFGGCSEDTMCFDSTYCPPEFHGPDIYEDEGRRYWHRFVSNREVLFGLCLTTARCAYVKPPRSLLLMCNCNPMPRPRCFADGCPILIETGAGGFRLTDAADGVDFDLVGHGVPSRVAWTEPGGDDAWLVLDRNGNGRIDDATELFGDRAPQPPAGERHGFLALALFDEPAHGGDGNGWIGAGDAVFDDLRLWLDHDHDGVSDLGELIPLASADVEAIGLDFFRSERRDRHGNRFRYSARVRLASGGHRLATDVFLQFE